MRLWMCDTKRNFFGMRGFTLRRDKQLQKVEVPSQQDDECKQDMKDEESAI